MSGAITPFPDSGVDILRRGPRPWLFAVAMGAGAGVAIGGAAALLVPLLSAALAGAAAACVGWCAWRMRALRVEAPEGATGTAVYAGSPERLQRRRQQLIDERARLEDTQDLQRGVFEVSAELVGCVDEADARARFAAAMRRYWAFDHADLMVCKESVWRCLGGAANGAPPQVVDVRLGEQRLAEPITLPATAGGDLVLDLGGGGGVGVGNGDGEHAALVLRNARPQPSIDRRESSVHRYVAEVLRGQFALSLKRVVLFGELQALARIDPLTGTHRRWYAESRLGELVEAGEVLAVAMIDIDFFKRVNDQFGHAAGDQVLEMVGRTLVSTLRSSDLVARFGGEEFLAILPETNPTGAELVAERLRSAVARIKDLPASVTVSIGIAACNQDETVESLVARADKALYRAKAAGRNRVMVEGGGELNHLRTTARKTRHGTTSLVRRAGGTTAITAAMTTPPLPPPPDAI